MCLQLMEPHPKLGTASWQLPNINATNLKGVFLELIQIRWPILRLFLKKKGSFLKIVVEGTLQKKSRFAFIASLDKFQTKIIDSTQIYDIGFLLFLLLC